MTKLLSVTQRKAGYSITAKWEGGLYADVWVVAAGAESPVCVIYMNEEGRATPTRAILKRELAAHVREWDASFVRELLMSVGARNV